MSLCCLCLRYIIISLWVELHHLWMDTTDPLRLLRTRLSHEESDGILQYLHVKPALHLHCSALLPLCLFPKLWLELSCFPKKMFYFLPTQELGKHRKHALPSLYIDTDQSIVHKFNIDKKYFIGSIIVLSIHPLTVHALFFSHFSHLIHPLFNLIPLNNSFHTHVLKPRQNSVLFVVIKYFYQYGKNENALKKMYLIKWIRILQKLCLTHLSHLFWFSNIYWPVDVYKIWQKPKWTKN